MDPPDVLESPSRQFLQEVVPEADLVEVPVPLEPLRIPSRDPVVVQPQVAELRHVVEGRSFHQAYLVEGQVDGHQTETGEHPVLDLLYRVVGQVDPGEVVDHVQTPRNQLFHAAAGEVDDPDSVQVLEDHSVAGDSVFVVARKDAAAFAREEEEGQEGEGGEGHVVGKRFGGLTGTVLECWECSEDNI